VHLTARSFRFGEGRWKSRWSDGSAEKRGGKRKGGGNGEKTTAPEPPNALVRRNRACKLGVASESWQITSKAKIDIRSDLPRNFVGIFLGQCFFVGGASMSGIFESQNAAAVTQWGLG